MGKIIPLNLLAQATGQKFIAPFYHTVSDENLSHIKHLYRYKSVKEFEDDLDQMLAVYEPISIEELHQLILENRLNAEERMFLSFDDGLRECSDIIAPILERKGVPATFFLNPAFIGNKDLMYRYKASLTSDKLEKAGTETKKEVAQLIGNGKNEKTKLFRSVLDINYSNRDLLDKAADILNLDFDKFLSDFQPYMGIGEIKNLQERGFSVGAHSMDHPLYGQLSEKKQNEQTEQSIDEINELFAPALRSFAYPFTDHGVSGSFIWGTLEHLADLTFGTAGIKKDIHPRHVQRIPMEGNSEDATSILKGEYLYYLLKAPLGRNKIARS